ncbi:MAG: Rpn family recombination-promoting nuclease/putative transposase [Hormoscilla sp. GUM202]|nr:Rpn family recombination-promoting nuclease/putative transposase [Hormoscilla sp. GUM202]
MAKQIFISPTIDYAFKKIFGSDRSEDILISFLNAIIYNGKNVISALTIVNPYNQGHVETLKDSYLDVRAVLQNGEIVLIEMQLARVAAFGKRVAYNLCKSYANQLESGEDYLKISPVIAVTITNFVLFHKHAQVIHHLVFKEAQGNYEYPERELQLFFVELPKFKKELKDLTTLADKWIYFIKLANELEEIPATLAEIAEIDKALKIAKLANMEPDEADEVIRRSIYLQDEIGRMRYASEEAWEQGIEQGIERGRITEARALALRLLKKKFGEMTAEINSKIESLSLSNLEGLTEDIFEITSQSDLLNWLSEVDSHQDG